ncbi:MAG: YdeI/OmpD-associated family protein [Chitinophagaceae bacterium]
MEQLIIPKDLDKELKKWKGAKDYFSQLSKSTKKAMLQWIVLAKQSETRQRRISEIAELAAQEKKPKQF